MLIDVLEMRMRRARHKLADLAGRPVWEDTRVGIYAPWGDPTPCDDSMPKDVGEAGRTDVATVDLFMGQQNVLIDRVFAGDRSATAAAAISAAGHGGLQPPGVRR